MTLSGRPTHQPEERLRLLGLLGLVLRARAQRSLSLMTQEQSPNASLLGLRERAGAAVTCRRVPTWAMTQTDNRSIQTPQSFPCSWCSQECSSQGLPHSSSVMLNRSSWAPNPTASITFQPTDASLCKLKVPQTPGTADTHLGPAMDAAVGSDPHKQHGMNTLTCKTSESHNSALSPKAQGMFQTPILLTQTPQVPSQQSKAQTLTRHEPCWSPPGPPPAAQPALYPNPAP